MKAIICVGVPASGKSSWAEEYVRNRDNWVIAERDKIRFPDGIKDWGNWNWKKERRVTEEHKKIIKIAAVKGMNVIVSDTNINNSRREQLQEDLEVLGYDVEIKKFDIELREAIKRDNARAGGVGQSVIVKMYLDLYGFKYEPTDGEKVYIFDIDGTVADHKGRRSCYEWDAVGQDDVKTEIMDIAKSLNRAGYGIVFLSGRDGSCEPQTREWLNEHFGTDYELFMREAGDMRRDSVIKWELFDRYINGMYHVMAVVDDRPQVIKETWLPLGVNTLCVGNPYIDF